MTNLEVVLTDGEQYATPPRTVRDQYQYLGSFPGVVLPSRPSNLDELLAMGIDMFATASNHSLDFGRVGMASTMRALEERNATYSGLGKDLPDARAPAFAHASGTRVGLVTATASVPPGGEAGPASSLLPGRPGVSPLHVEWTYRVADEHLEQLRTIARETGLEDVADTWLRREGQNPRTSGDYRFGHMTFESAEDGAPGIELSASEFDAVEILAEVREAESTSDVVVASVHAHQGPGGTRNVSETPDFLVDFARDCIDAGADVFVGTGPHVLRGIELYDGAPIFYSLGNFFAQFETIRHLPAQSFEYYGIEDDRYPSSVFDARYYDDGEPSGSLADQHYWRTVIPRCEFDDEGALERIELLPCTLGQDAPRSRRGTPRRASDDDAREILAHLQSISDRFGTTIEQEAGIGVIDPS
jgi:poly-gamma-glutamate synthesis protein (capsule biosynthesis protein)